MLRIILILSGLMTLVNVHNFSLSRADGTTLSLGEFEGKKILLVNVSTGSPLNYQLRGLQELQRIYSNSLVVVAVPSNSFGTENHSAAEINRICRDEFGTRFFVAAPVEVKGATAHPLYKWLENGEANGAGQLSIKEDFQKFLFDKNGEVLGIYTASVDPLDSSIHKAIIGERN